MMRYLNYVLIILGAVVAMYANSANEQNIIILICGIVLLMTGVYRVSRNISSKNEPKDDINDSENQ